jgi:Ni/Co efflux regulator RcnB
MRLVHRAVAVSTLALTLAGGIAVAQDHPDQDHPDQSHYVRHDDWKKGNHIQNEDWSRGARVDDWKAHHLHQPPAGYEWRMIDGQYVCANNDGVILRVTVAPH